MFLSRVFNYIIRQIWDMDTKYTRLNSHRNGKANRRVLIFVALCLLLLVVFYYAVYWNKTPSENSPVRGVSRPNLSSNVPSNVSNLPSHWPVYINTPLKPAELIKRNCFGGHFVTDLGSLEHKVNHWKKSVMPHCREYYEIFSKMFTVSFRTGTVKLPTEFVPKVSGWLNNDPDLMAQLEKQEVIHIFNEYSREYMAFSPLRSKRPQAKPIGDPRAYVDELVKKAEIDCDFCKYKIRTAEDSFGRIITNFSATAANTFKVDRWHSLVLPHRHHPLEMTEQETVDMFETAVLWTQKVHSLEDEFKFPWMLWDSMPHAGASQIHPHIHVGLTPNMYVGLAESTRRGADVYFHETGRNFFNDLTEIHHMLGLTVVLGQATAMTQLTSKKDTEVTIISAKPNKDFFRLIYYTVQAFIDMGFYDLSSLCVLPSVGEKKDGSLPAIMRITTRGDVSNVRSEISSFELFQFTNINVDPYVVIEKVRHSVETRSKH